MRNTTLLSIMITGFAVVFTGCTHSTITSIHSNSTFDDVVATKCEEYDTIEEASNAIIANMQRGWRPFVSGHKVTCFIFCVDWIQVCYERIPPSESPGKTSPTPTTESEPKEKTKAQLEWDARNKDSSE